MDFYFLTSLTLYLSLSSLLFSPTTSQPAAAPAVIPADLTNPIDAAPADPATPSIPTNLIPATSITPTTPPTTPGTIHRTTKQQIIATIPPSSPSSSTQPFLTSPSAKYSAYFLRRHTVLGAGGFGNDFCYIQIQDAATEHPVWESECAPVSTSNACSLLLSDDGLSVFDGSNSAWQTDAQSADDNPLETLELVDEGDMRIRDKDGELAWKASEDPRTNQQCGEAGSPGLAPALPPFAEPIGAGGNLPFGQQQQQGGATGVGGGRQQQAAESGSSVSGAFGFSSNGQPLVDSTPYDSGCEKGWVGLGSGLVFSWLVAVGFVF